MADHFSLDVDLPSLRAARGKLDALAEGFATAGPRISGHGTGLTSWTGPASVTIKGEIEELGRVVGRFEGKLTSARSAVTTFIGEVESFIEGPLATANTQWAQVHADAEADRRQAATDFADDEEKLGERRGEIATGLRWSAQAIAYTYAQERQALMAKAETLGSTLAGLSPVEVPEAVARRFVDGGGSGTRLSFTDDQGDFPPDLDANAQLGALHLSQDGDSIEEGADLAQELVDAQGDISPELAAELAERSDDPYFAYGLASALTPEQAAEVLWHFDQLRWGNDDDTVAETWSDLVTGLGQTLATATRGEGPLALTDDHAEAFADAITAETGSEGGDAPVGQSQYLGLLLEQGVWGTDFLGTVAERMYDYERSRDGGPVWGPKLGPGQFITGPDSLPRYDTMASLMAALGNNAEAAQDFFSEGGTTTLELADGTLEVNERLHYLVSERTWDHMTDATNGGNLGLALEAATTELRNAGASGRTSAEITTQLLAVIGDRTGEGSDDPGPFNDDGWQMWDGMRGSVADILASYATDLMRLGRGGPGDDLAAGHVDPESDLYLEGMPYGAALDPDLVRAVVGTLAEDDAHVETVLSGLAVAASLRMSGAFNDALGDGGDPPAPVVLLQGGNIPGISTATNESAATLGWLLNAAYHGRLDDEELAAAQAELRGKMFDALTAVPGVGPAGEWTKFAFEQATGAVSDAISESEATAGGEYGELSAGEQERLEQMLLNQMLGAGYFDPAYADQAAGAEGSTRFTPPPPDAVTGNPPRFDFESPAFQEWQRTGFPMDAFLNTHVFPPFTQGLEAGLDLAGG